MWEMELNKEQSFGHSAFVWPKTVILHEAEFWTDFDFGLG